jgi:hypothetical protein
MNTIKKRKDAKIIIAVNNMKDLNELIQGKKPAILNDVEFELFIEIYVDTCYSGGRLGQAYMHALHQVRPDIYEEVTMCTFRDCFYNDSKITNLINYLNGREWQIQID